MRINIVSCSMVKEKSLNYQGVQASNRTMNSPNSIYSIAKDVLQLDMASEEYFYVIMLNTKNGINGIAEVSHGNLNASLVHPREVFKLAILANAYSVIFLHNHPSGDTEPSKDDIEITSRLIQSSDILGIKVLDHVIIGDNRYTSLKERGLM